MISRNSFVRWCELLVCICIVIQLTGVRMVLLPGTSTTQQKEHLREPPHDNDNLAAAVASAASAAAASHNSTSSFHSHAGSSHIEKSFVPKELWNLPASERLSRPESLQNMPKYLQDYIQFHKERVWTKPNGKVRLVNDETPFLVYGCNKGNCGGVADRLNGILTMLHMAICTKRVLIIDADYPMNLTEFLQPNLIQWDVVKYAKKVQILHTERATTLPEPFLLDPQQYLPSHITNIGMRPNVWLGNPGRGYANYSACMRQRPADEPFHDFNGTHADEMYRWGFWALFKFHDDVLERATDLKLQAGLSHLIQPSNSTQYPYPSLKNQTNAKGMLLRHDPYLGVHVRTGTGFVAGRHDPVRHGQTEWKIFLQCTQRFYKFINLQQEQQQQQQQQQQEQQQKRQLQNTRRQLSQEFVQPLFYVASDNDQAKQYFLAEAPNTARAADGIDSFHVDRSDPTAVANLKQDLLDVWAEFVILLDSTCLIRSRSGFSEVPTILGESNPGSRYHCGVVYNQCDDHSVQLAVSRLGKSVIEDENK